MGQRNCKIQIIVEDEEFLPKAQRENRPAPCACAGTTLKGKVAAKFKNPTGLEVPTKLTLTLSGVEISTIHENDGTQEGFPTIRKKTLKRKICQITCILCSQEYWGRDGIPADRVYVIPFQIRLPRSLPAHLPGLNKQSKLSLNKTDFCRIVYFLSVTASPRGVADLPNLGAREILMKGAIVPNEIVPATITGNASLKLKNPRHNVMVGKGTLTFAARVDDVHVGRGDQVQVYLACANHAICDILQVKMVLMEKVIWYGKKKDSSQYNLRVLTLIPSQELLLPGIHRSAGSDGPDRSRSSSDTVMLDDLYAQLFNPDNRVNLTIPHSCRDTYEQGTLIKVQHFIQVTFYTKHTITDGVLKIPITIAQEAPASPYQRASPPATASAEVWLPHEDSFQEADIPVVRAVAPPEVNTSSNTTFASSVSTMATTTSFTTVSASATSSVSTDTVATVVHASHASNAPLVEAALIEIPEDAVAAPLATAPPEWMVLGGDVQEDPEQTGEQDDDNPLAAAPIPMPIPIPSAPMAPIASTSSAATASMEGLMLELERSIDDYNLLVEKLHDPVWAVVLSELTPNEFGTILLFVDVEPDQAKTAELLAKHMHRANSFTCEHAKAGINNVAPWIRATTVEKILPCCNDLDAHGAELLSLLTEWERRITRDVFQRVAGVGVDC